MQKKSKKALQFKKIILSLQCYSGLGKSEYALVKSSLVFVLVESGPIGRSQIVYMSEFDVLQRAK